MRTTPPLPIPVKKSLSKLGTDIRTARIRRRITMEQMANRVFVSRITIGKMEKGDPSVSMGVYAIALFVLGISARLDELADIRNDELGLALEQENLPKRVRPRNLKKAKKTS